MDYTYRTVKGSPLTHEEYDANWALAEEQYTLAEAAAASAAGAANFKGKWERLTGAAYVPYSVLHNGSIYVLTTNIPNILLSEPSITNTDWLMIPFNQYTYIRDEKVSGVAGGTFTAGSWQTRDLNTVVNDAIGSSLSASSVVSLPSGTYRFCGRSPAYGVNAHKVRLANISDSVYFYGTSAYADNAANGFSYSTVSGKFTITSTTNFELQHKCDTTVVSVGFGVQTSLAAEVYAELEFWRE